MQDRWGRSLIRLGLAVVVLAGGSAQAQNGLGPWSGASNERGLNNLRGSFSFFYRSNELGGADGFSSFGPQLQVDGSLLGDRFFYSANLAFSHRERLMGDDDAVAGAGDSSVVGGARVGFRLGKKSFFEFEYSNDGMSERDDSVLFLNGHQQSSLGGRERGKSYFLALRNETRLGTVARLSTSFKYTDHSSTLALSSTARGPLPDLMPDYLRRLEIKEHAQAQVNLLGQHQLESGVRFFLDQIGIRASSGDPDGELYQSTQMRASSIGFFLQDRWHVARGWNMHMGVAYDLPGAQEVQRRSEWSLGMHKRVSNNALQYGANAFLRGGFPQLAAHGRGTSSMGLALGQDSPYHDLFGLDRKAYDYAGLELFLSRPLFRSFGFFLSYTIQQLRNFGGEQVAFGTVEADVPSIARAQLPAETPDAVWEQTHLVHLNTVYRVNSGLLLGSTVNYLYANPMEFVTAEATLISPAADHNVSIDMHVEKALRVGSSEVELLFDVFNVLDSGSLIAYDTRYDLDLAALSGRRFQVGMRYGF